MSCRAQESAAGFDCNAQRGLAPPPLRPRASWPKPQANGPTTQALAGCRGAQTQAGHDSRQPEPPANPADEPARFPVQAAFDGLPTSPALPRHHCRDAAQPTPASPWRPRLQQAIPFARLSRPSHGSAATSAALVARLGATRDQAPKRSHGEQPARRDDVAAPHGDPQRLKPTAANQALGVAAPRFFAAPIARATGIPRPRAHRDPTPGAGLALLSTGSPPCCCGVSGANPAAADHHRHQRCATTTPVARPIAAQPSSLRARQWCCSPN